MTDLDKFWLENFVCVRHGLCVLCANTGYVDTRHSAVSPAGVKCGARVPCFCPNGRAFAPAIPVAQSVHCGVLPFAPAGSPTLIVTSGLGGSRHYSVVYGPLPKEPRLNEFARVPIYEEDGQLPLNELAAMFEAGTLKRREA